MKRRRRRRHPVRRAILAVLTALVALTVLAGCALSQRLAVRSYQVTSDGIARSVRLAVIADLHETPYGENQAELMAALRAQAPDAVCLVGDILDGSTDGAAAWQLIEQLTAAYRCYYVTGNHEFWTGRAEEYIERMTECGVTVLRGTGDVLTVGSAQVAILGVDDPDGLTAEAWTDQLERCRDLAAEAAFSVLLSHRPERIAGYAGFDLALCGHAHGGQVRLPFLFNGLYAPNQGWFPEYAGGFYDLEDGGAMIVSRGLARNRLPRVFNRPELVIVDILPAQG